MQTPDQPPSETSPEEPVLLTLIELRESCSLKARGRWPGYIITFLFGVIAAIQGGDVFVLYCGALAVVFTINSFNEDRTRKQIDLLLHLAQELKRNKS